MNMTQIGIFMALAEHLNFSKTAAALYVTQSYVSKQIASLEEEWQIQLFVRDHHKVTMTPAGRHMYEFWLHTQSDMVKALQRAKALNLQNNMHLHIGVFSHLDFRQGPEAIRRLRAMYPIAQFSIEFCTEERLMSRLWDRRLDVIITNRDAIRHWSGVRYEELMLSNYCVSISHDRGLSGTFESVLPQLAEIDLITLTDATMSIRTLLNTLERKYEVELHPRLEAPNLEALHRMVESGMGFAFVDSSPSNIPAQPRLSFFDTGIPWSIGLVWRADNENTLIQAFRDTLKALPPHL